MVHALARHPGHVKDRDALMRDANIVVDDSTITSHVKRIRRKFLAVDPAFDRIATVYGMGYRWIDGGIAMPRVALGIRAQLLLVLTVFLALPWLGVEYVRELERVLRDAQERTLAGTAQAVATALHDRPRLFARRRIRSRRSRASAPNDRDHAGASLPPSASPEIAQIIEGLSRTTARIWVIDRDGTVLARAGSLQPPADAATPDSLWTRVSRATIGRLYRWSSSSRPRISATTPPRRARRAAATSRARSPASSPPTAGRRRTARR